MPPAPQFKTQLHNVAIHLKGKDRQRSPQVLFVNSLMQLSYLDGARLTLLGTHTIIYKTLSFEFWMVFVFNVNVCLGDLGRNIQIYYTCNTVIINYQFSILLNDNLISCCHYCDSHLLDRIFVTSCE